MAEDINDDLNGEENDENEEEAVLPPYPAYEDVEVELWAILGRTDVRISNLLKIGRGALIDLDREISDQIEIFANGQRIALAEIVLSDDKLAFRVIKVFKRNLLFNEFPILNKMLEAEHQEQAQAAVG